MTRPRTRRPDGAAEADASALLGEIGAFCRRRGMSEREFGRRCLGDTAFVREVRGGRMVKPTTVSRCRAWMAKVDGTRDLPPLQVAPPVAPPIDPSQDRVRQLSERQSTDALHARLIAMFNRDAREKGCHVEEAMFDHLHPGWRGRVGGGLAA